MADRFEKIFHGAPAFRLKQALAGLFQMGARGWEDIKTLPVDIRVTLSAVLWLTVQKLKIFKSKDERTRKAILFLQDGLKIETVLMENARSLGDAGKRYTVCVSAQVGCAMGCVFCATGKMGLFRHLSVDEIIDQYRFWCEYLEEHDSAISTAAAAREAITNIVFMGMGEPMQNYANVRDACRMFLEFTKIGPTHIVVSTVGVKHSMEKLLTDPLWPPVRIAISTHSGIEATRKKIVPSHAPGLLEFFVRWAEEYHKKYPERSRHISLEYVLLDGVNDSAEEARALATLAGRMGRVRVNLIFWNPVAGADFHRSIPAAALAMQKILKERGVMCTIRDTQGQDIEAACGQLIVQEAGAAKKVP